jgi:hypothetical protein
VGADLRVAHRVLMARHRLGFIVADAAVGDRESRDLQRAAHDPA